MEHRSRLLLENHRSLIGRLVRLAGPYEVEGELEPVGDKYVPYGTLGVILDCFVPSDLEHPVQYRVQWRCDAVLASYVDCMVVDVLPEVPDLSDRDAVEEWLTAS